MLNNLDPTEEVPENIKLLIKGIIPTKRLSPAEMVDLLHKRVN
jgi:hypothetical protein